MKPSTESLAHSAGGHLDFDLTVDDLIAELDPGWLEMAVAPPSRTGDELGRLPMSRPHLPIKERTTWNHRLTKRKAVIVPPGRVLRTEPGSVQRSA